MEALQKENEELKKELERYRNPKQHHSTEPKEVGDDSHHVSIIVVGGSGDLAKKKTFPTLFALHCLGLLPKDYSIWGYARTKMDDEEFRKDHVGTNFKEWPEKKEEFLKRCHYYAGAYDSGEAFAGLAKKLEEKENGKKGDRLFYLAIPPSIFVDVAKAVKAGGMAKTGWTRVVIEKPFGRDLETSSQLSAELAKLFEEDQMYRIDHYLGKEMVQNLLNLRFANSVFEPIWSRQFISSIQITFKEDIGTEGRGGYFDQFGIIRDVMQNHLMQIFSLVAMEAPVQLDAEFIRDEKVKVLRACQDIDFKDLVIGQFGPDPEKGKQGYLDDKTVPKGSLVPTFATAVVHINNARWKGVPFILKCGKGLNERKAEIRIQFHSNPSSLYKDAARNELVIRVQPDEAVYMKFNVKKPGLTEEVITTELDLTYKKRYDARLPDAYERLVYDVLRGDHNLFVRVDELEEAWRMFTPILHKIENEKIQPIVYKFGSRGPEEADKLIHKYGFQRDQDYTWSKNA
eukprot:TRINITY_DN3475_c0_g1_i1.p1 TRINITY_DN3475_c0_g1~~TRINITY_DN3475_c0_g1_i1.p1  ORF type:complete len:524 (-),score=184.34 TRINITY_DN3475_c0_g1_i1:304-1845(-)